MKTRKILFLIFIFLIFHLRVFAQVDSVLRGNAIEEALKKEETKIQFQEALFMVQERIKHFPIPLRKSPKVIAEGDFLDEEPREPSPKLEENLFSDKKAYSQRLDLGPANLRCGVQFAHIDGTTVYDFDNHTSELTFPLRNPMVGANLSLALRNLTLNTQISTTIAKDAGSNMKDKDWISGILVSYTKSKAKTDATIYDANLQYDFYSFNLSKETSELALQAQDKIKIGALLGYRYERFDFDMYDLYYVIGSNQGQTLYQGQKVLTYKIANQIPYFGIATNLRRKNFEMDLFLKYSFYPTAWDVDNHLLRELTFYGDYDQNGSAILGSINGFWKFAKNWRFKLGADLTYLEIDGSTWEESHDPAWDKDQSTVTQYIIFSTGIEYRF